MDNRQQEIYTACYVSDLRLNIPREWMLMTLEISDPLRNHGKGDDRHLRGQRTGLIYHAVRRIVVEVDEETLLDVNGSDAHDGREEEEQVGDQLHGCDVGE